MYTRLVITRFSKKRETAIETGSSKDISNDKSGSSSQKEIASPNENEIKEEKEPKEKKKKKRPAIEDWVNKSHKKYKPWAGLPVLHPDYSLYVKCVWCDKEILIDSLYGTDGHLKSDAHKKKEAYYIKKSEKEKNIEIISDSNAKKLTLFEFDLCNLLIQMNLPFSDVEPIYKFLYKYSKSSLVKDCKINRHKASETIKSQLLPFLKDSLENDLRNYRFSLIIDESTDMTKKKFLAIMVQYLHPSEGVLCKLHSFKECSIDASAEALFKIVDEEILKKDFSKNLIGYVSDGAPVMNGMNNSILSRLQNLYPNLWYMYCLNHALHLVACHAAKVIPSEVEEFIKQSYKFFKNSAKRLAEFNSVTEGMNLDVKQLLKPGQTRWLSLQLAVDRILTLWEPLFQYFKEVDQMNLIKAMTTKTTKIYLQFMSTFLKKFNFINLIFQREVSQMFYAKDEICKFLVGLAQNILVKSYNVNEETKYFDPWTMLELSYEDNEEFQRYLLSDSEQYDTILKIYGNVIHLKDVSKQEGLQVCQIFQKFIQNALKDLKRVLPLKDLVLNRLSAFDPETSIACDLIEIGQVFTNIIPPEIYHEYFDQVTNWIFDLQKLKEIRKKFLITAQQDFDIVSFFQQKTLQIKYPLVVKLAQALLGLPHSSATIERAFSQLKLIKNEKRCNLANDTLESLMITKVNEINIEDEIVMENLYQYYEKKQILKKRKSDQMSSEDKDDQTREDTHDIMIPESHSIKDSTTKIYKKLKSENSSILPENSINLGDFNVELTLPALSKISTFLSQLI